MRKNNTTKISFDINSDLLKAIDTFANENYVSRSAVLNIWLRRGALAESEVIRLMGSKKFLKKLDSIDSSCLENLEASFQRSGHFIAQSGSPGVMLRYLNSIQNYAKHATDICDRYSERLDPNEV